MLRDTKSANCCHTAVYFQSRVDFKMCQKTIRPFHIFKKLWNAFLKVIDCTQQLQVRENVVGFEKALGAVKVIKDQSQ